MKTIVASILALAIAMPLVAAGEFGDPIRGQSLFVNKQCVECHAVRGAGGRIGPDLGRTAAKRSFFELVAAMWNHSPMMDEKILESRLVRPTFTGDELADLLAFIYFLNYFDEPGDPKSGKALFAEKHCIQCHAIGREGGTTGPRLDRLPRGTSPIQIAQKLWNHGPVMLAMMRARSLQTPTFKENEILDLFAYLRAHGERTAARDFRSAGNPNNGMKAFRSKGCTTCHAVFGDGGEIGPDLGSTELRGSVTQLAGRMWNHWPAMADAMEAMGMRSPVFRDEELADIFAYIFISRYHGEAAAADLGRTIYVKKGCSSCHGVAREGNVGPSLRRIHAESKERVAQRLWNHAPAMWSRMGAEKIPWPRFEPHELAALLRFLATE